MSVSTLRNKPHYPKAAKPGPQFLAHACPKAPCTHIVYTKALRVFLYRYFKAEVYTQTFQYPLIKEYSLNYTRTPNMT